MIRYRSVLCDCNCLRNAVYREQHCGEERAMKHSVVCQRLPWRVLASSLSTECVALRPGRHVLFIVHVAPCTPL